MAVDINQIRAFQYGLVAVSAYGATVTLPTDATTPLSAIDFSEVGAISSDGITDSTSQDFNDIFMWQGNDLAASLPGEFVKTFKFACMELNATTAGLTYSGSTITQTAYGLSIAETSPARDLRSWVIHGIDGTRLQRIVIPNGQVSERGDIVWSSTDVTVFEYTVKCFPDDSGNVSYRYIVDDALAL